jgi:hypothetical protein
MGCSPPAEWYAAQDAMFHQRRRLEHQEAVRKLLDTVEYMTDEERTRFRYALDIHQGED